MRPDETLFYQGLVQNGTQIVLNKKLIESVTMVSELVAEVIMKSGKIHRLSMNGTMFGELMFYLSEIGHGSEN